MKTTITALLVILWASFARADVIVIHRRPSVIVHSAPAVAYVAPAPVVSYSAPVYSVRLAAGPTGAQLRHARKAANHAQRAAYWASRS